MPMPDAAPRRDGMARTRRLLPRGHTLPAQELRRRHRALLVLLWLHAVLLPLRGVGRGFDLGHSILEGGAIAVCAAAATFVGAPLGRSGARRARPAHRL